MTEFETFEGTSAKSLNAEIKLYCGKHGMTEIARSAPSAGNNGKIYVTCTFRPTTEADIREKQDFADAKRKKDMAKPISDLMLDRGIVKILEEEGYKTLGDIIEAKRKKLLKIRGIGVVKVNAIGNAVKYAGYMLYL